VVLIGYVVIGVAIMYRDKSETGVKKSDAADVASKRK
jgi:hypothetical protein